MKSSIYVSAEQIQVIGYSGGAVRQYVSYPLPEGTIYNGTITDSAFLIECLTSLKKSDPELFKRGVSLIVDGSAILSRRLTAPRLNRKRYLQMVRDDFADSIDDTANLVCGYRVLEGSENAILGCAVNKVLVDSYLSAFKEAGIKLTGIRIGVEAILNYVRSRPELRKSTVVLNVIDGPTMLSMLFESGINVFMSRTRLYGDEKEQVFQSVLENLNGLIQFAKSQNINEISQSFYLGINDADINLLAAFNPHTEININTLPVYKEKGKVPPEAHFACLNMLFGDKGVDLIAARAELNKYIKSKKPKKLWIPLLAAYIVILAAPAVYLLFEVRSVEADIDEIETHLNSPAVVAKQAELNDVTAETMLYNNISRQVDEKTGWENSIPKAVSGIFNLIMYEHGVEVRVNNFEFDEAKGTVRVSAVCLNAKISADYVDALYENDVVRNIEYTGYGSDNFGMYTFGIEITLNAGVGQ